MYTSRKIKNFTFRSNIFNVGLRNVDRINILFVIIYLHSQNIIFSLCILTVNYHILNRNTY